MRRLADLIATCLAALGRFPGQIIERALGLYLAGWGLVACLSPRMFENGPQVYAALAPRPEWSYGLVFLAVGLFQVVVAAPGSRVRRRHAAALAGALVATGLALAFAHTGATSGAYTYGCVGAAEVALVARLLLLRHFNERRGLHVRSTYTLTAVRPSAPHTRPAR